MKISFYGATREVTGSCYLVETDQARILVDCGMFQGSAFSDAKNFQSMKFDPSTIDAIVVTHAHLDHVGRIPKLIHDGYRGSIYATPPTLQIARLVLEDAEQIMEEDARREYRPKLYEAHDVELFTERGVAVEYGAEKKFGDLICRFHDAGHIFGSSFIEIRQQGGPSIVFSGDLGNRDAPILRPTERLPACDAVVIESTYGNRLHENESLRENRLKEVILKTVRQKGVLLIPAFAVERTQELLYELNHLIENRLIDPIDMYLDSPMAIEVSQVITRFPQYYNSTARRLITDGDALFQFPGLRLTRTRDESKTINETPRPKIIISGAGMMNGGRILHHLIRYLSDPRSTVLIIGYQAAGTLGRRLYTGERIVNVLGERVEVKAEIISIGAYSAHADQRKLIDWIGQAEKLPGRVFCTHGEEESSEALASRLHEELSIQADVPRFEQTIVL
jgi:metallo-beta-lactamase family protein